MERFKPANNLNQLFEEEPKKQENKEKLNRQLPPLP